MDFQYGVLHNRKTAGTALRDMILQQEQRTSQMTVRCFEHAMTFPKFVKHYPHARAIFFVRDPISKFVSGFYSRLRQGQPRYYYPWSSAEKRAFKRFQHPNDLAEALSHRNPFKRYMAVSAMKSIGHVRHSLLDFLGSPTFLQQASERIAFIGHQPEFMTDVEHLRLLLKLDNDITAPNDETRAHRNPSHSDKFLSEKAIKNLKKWYKVDFDIYTWCLAHRENLISKKK